MSIFGKIVSAIFGRAKADTPAAAEATGAGGAGGAPATPASAGVAPQPPAGPTPLSQVDVEEVLTKAAGEKKEKLNWKTSIVDLMKVLDLDSSLQARKDLAKELGYSGDTGDSAKMNIWLHKQVMTKLAQNGGKVPADLKD
jgi:hypothetical protein